MTKAEQLKIDHTNFQIQLFLEANRDKLEKEIEQLKQENEKLKEAMIGFKDMMQKSINVMQVLGFKDMHIIAYHDTIKKVNELCGKGSEVDG